MFSGSWARLGRSVLPQLPNLWAPNKMRIKKVYVNDVLIGEASTWTQVYALLKAKNIRLIGNPGAAEGPGAFFLSGAVLRKGEGRSKSADGVA